VGPDQVENLLAFRRADILAHGKHNSNQDLLFELDQRIRQQMATSPPIQRSDLAIDGHTVMSSRVYPPARKWAGYCVNSTIWFWKIPLEPAGEAPGNSQH
jgi:hypothetical protein